MGLCKTSNFSIFTFINARDLKFCTRSYSSCVYRMMRFKSSNGKVCKMMTSHFRTLMQECNQRNEPHHKEECVKISNTAKAMYLLELLWPKTRKPGCRTFDSYFGFFQMLALRRVCLSYSSVICLYFSF